MTQFSPNRAKRNQRRRRLIQQLWQVLGGASLTQAQQRLRRFAVERLEDRRVMAFSATVLGNVATFVGDGSSDTIRVDGSAVSLLRHNRFSAGDAGFNSEFDFDSTVAGDQTLAIGSSSTVRIDTGAGSDTINIGTNLFPASTMFSNIDIFAGGTGDVLNVNDSTHPIPHSYTVTSGAFLRQDSTFR